LDAVPVFFPQQSQRKFNKSDRRGPQLLYVGLNLFSYAVSVARLLSHIRMSELTYKGWNFNSDNYLFTTDTK